MVFPGYVTTRHRLPVYQTPFLLYLSYTDLTAPSNYTHLNLSSFRVLIALTPHILFLMTTCSCYLLFTCDPSASSRLFPTHPFPRRHVADSIDRAFSCEMSYSSPVLQRNTTLRGLTKVALRHDSSFEDRRTVMDTFNNMKRKLIGKEVPVQSKGSHSEPRL